MTTPLLRRSLAILAIVALTLTLLPVTPAASQTPPPASSLDWTGCYRQAGQQTGVRFECARLAVPLDHDRPDRRMIEIALVRLPARGTSRGSILLNPGGPGGSGVDFAVGFGPFAGFVWGEDVRDEFDLVGFDPRGISRSATLQCFDNESQAVGALPPILFPLTRDEVTLFVRANGLLSRRCGRSGEGIGEHMSTANVARDMDLIREALGDDRLSYVGYSYGSYLGQTYANLFPDRVRAVVIDGVLDPVAWSNVEGEVPFSSRIRSDEGAQETLVRFFELCDAAGDACALAPDAADRYAAVAERLRTGPIVFEDPDTGELFPVSYQDLIGISLGSLYNSFALPDLAFVVALLEAEAAPAALGSALARLAESTGGLITTHGSPKYDNFVEGFPGVGCTDTVNPSSYRPWVRSGEELDELGYFGRIWTWASSPCAKWPFVDTDAYRGPYDAVTANPVLILSTLYDPATRLEGAQTARALLPNSALVTADVPGHTTLGASLCAGSATGQYLLDPSVAPSLDGLACPAEFDVFPSGPPEAPSIGEEVRTAVMSEIAMYPGR